MISKETKDDFNAVLQGVSRIARRAYDTGSEAIKNASVRKPGFTVERLGLIGVFANYLQYVYETWDEDKVPCLDVSRKIAEDFEAFISRACPNATVQRAEVDTYQHIESSIQSALNEESDETVMFFYRVPGETTANEGLRQQVERIVEGGYEGRKLACFIAQ